MKKEMTEQQVLQKLTLLCAQGEHCQQEMLEKMQRWGVAEDCQARVMEYLIGERYIDEERYCRGFVHDKLEYNRWGRRKIEQGLWAKGIDRSISAPILDSVEERRWVAALLPLIEQKRRSTNGRNEYEVNQKLMRFAIGRGFSFSQVRQCIDGVEDDGCYED